MNIPPSENAAPQVTIERRLLSREAALDILRAVLEERRALGDALRGHPGMPALSGRDQRFVRALVTACLRHLGQVDHILAQCLERPLPHRAREAHNVLRLGVTQSVYLGTPAHAAVDTMVTLATRRATAHKGLVNAVLRRIARDPASYKASAPAGILSLPDWLWQSWLVAYGEATATAIARQLQEEPPLDFTAKGDPGAWARPLDAVVMPGGTLRRQRRAERVTSDDGAPLAAAIEDLPGYAEGAWWVQDLAASLPVKLLGAVAGLRVIDLCAAPGGKTAQLAAAGAAVTALDRSPQRLERVGENLARLHLKATLEAADVNLWARADNFDIVLLDAPCSATGTLRRHPDAAWIKQPEDIGKLGKVQDRLLAAAMRLLRPGGTLLYCTCSLQPEEGPLRVEAFLAQTPEAIRAPFAKEAIPGLADIIDESGDLRTLPCHLAAAGGMDGFFAARLLRKD